MSNEFPNPHPKSIEYDFFNNIPPSPLPSITPFPLSNNYGVVFERIPQKLYNELDLQIKSVLNPQTTNIKVNQNLIGHIEKEFDLNPSLEMSNYIKNLSQKYSTIFPYEINSITNKITPTEKKVNTPQPPLLNKIEYDLSSLWVNIQEKHEYNPLHHHAGLYSFVIWHYIPYQMLDELQMGPGKAISKETNHNGKFQFFSPNGNKINSTDIPIDKKWNGMVGIFPSWLNHQVNPFFSSDEYRITVAGNVFLKV